MTDERMPTPSDNNKNPPRIPDELVRWHALRATYQAHLLSLVSNPMTGAFFDLSQVFPEANDLPTLLGQLDDLKKCLDSFRPLNPAQLSNLQGAWDIEYTYESNRIEGNTLTLQETGLVISEGITIGGKRLNEHLEAINHQEAIDYIRALAPGKSKLNAYTLNAIHALTWWQYGNRRQIGIAGRRLRPHHLARTRKGLGTVNAARRLSRNCCGRRGHIQAYDGKTWIGDFVQRRGFWPGEEYRNEQPKFVVYRP